MSSPGKPKSSNKPAENNKGHTPRTPSGNVDYFASASGGSYQAANIQSVQDSLNQLNIDPNTHGMSEAELYAYQYRKRQQQRHDDYLRQQQQQQAASDAQHYDGGRVSPTPTSSSTFQALRKRASAGVKSIKSVGSRGGLRDMYTAGEASAAASTVTVDKKAKKEKKVKKKPSQTSDVPPVPAIPPVHKSGKK